MQYNNLFINKHGYKNNGGYYHMNPREYLSNPMGKGSSIIPNPETKEKMKCEYEKVRNKITLNRYVLENRYLIYFLLIPSTSSMATRYNVVIQFDLNDNKLNNYENVDFLNFLCYSNCPSFIFTYANAFNKRNMLIPWLKSKYSKEIFADSKVRNTYELIGYEKSLYLSLLYILSNRRDIISEFIQNASHIKNPNKITREVLSSDDIMRLYSRNKSIEKEENKKKNPRLIIESAEIKSMQRKESANKHKIDHLSKVTKVKNTKHTSRIKHSKKI